MGSGRNVSVMGWNDIICISSHSSSNEGLTENGERILSGHSDSSLLEESFILPGPAVSDGCTSSQASNSEGSFDPSSFPSSLFVAGNPQPARKEASRRQNFLKLKSNGRACASKRASTKPFYKYRWNNWMDWCLQRWIPSIHL